MIWNVVWLLVGLFVGVNIGVLVMACVKVGSDYEKHNM